MIKNEKIYGYTNKPSSRPVRIVNGKYFNPNKYGLGGLIGSGLGAIGGSFIGQPALGAQVGGMVGSQFDNKSKGNTKKEDIINMGYGSLGTYAYGGSYRGGKARKVGNKGYSMEGRKHAQGGIMMSPEVEVEGDETIDTSGEGYVFSDRLTVPGRKETFAERHKKLVSMGADKTAIRDLRKMQERVSGRSKRNLGNRSANWGQKGAVTMPKGGYMKKFETGGEIGASYNMPTYGFNSEKVRTPQARAYEGTEASIPDSGGFDWKTTALQTAPDLINAATGIFGKDKTRKATKVNRATVDSQPINYNINPQLQRTSRAYRGILSNPNASANERMAALAYKGSNDAQAFARKSNVESQMRERRNIRQAGLDSNRYSHQASLDERYRQDKMMSEANLGISGNMTRQALSSISNKLLQAKRDQALTERDQRMIEMLRLYYGDDPSLTELFE